MTDVEKSIFEESEKINTVKATVKARASKIDDSTLAEEELSADDWKKIKNNEKEKFIR